MRERFDLAPFQQAFQASGLTGAQLERRCGWHRGHARRFLGLRPYVCGRRDRRYVTVARSLSYENAVRVARALDLDLVELGL